MTTNILILGFVFLRIYSVTFKINLNCAEGVTDRQPMGDQSDWSTHVGRGLDKSGNHFIGM